MAIPDLDGLIASYWESFSTAAPPFRVPLVERPDDWPAGRAWEPRVWFLDLGKIDNREMELHLGIPEVDASPEDGWRRADPPLAAHLAGPDGAFTFDRFVGTVLLRHIEGRIPWHATASIGGRSRLWAFVQTCPDDCFEFGEWFHVSASAADIFETVPGFTRTLNDEVQITVGGLLDASLGWDLPKHPAPVPDAVTPTAPPGGRHLVAVVAAEDAPAGPEHAHRSPATAPLPPS